MPEWDYIIVGGGPTGIALASILCKTPHTVLLLESAHMLGGNWKVDWEMDTYVTEHSPKVILSNYTQFFRLLKHIGYTTTHRLTDVVHPIDKNDTYKQLWLLWKHTTFSDVSKWIQLFTSYWTNPSFDYYESVQQWSHTSGLSKKHDQYLQKMAIVFANTYDKLSIGAFVEFVMYYIPKTDLTPYQFAQPHGWIEQATRFLHKHNNVHVQLNVHVRAISRHYVESTTRERYYGSNIVLATPVRSIYTILKHSSQDIQRNWFSNMKQWKYFVDTSTYVGFGFQLHFDKEVNEPFKYCWSCFGAWSIIVVPRSTVLSPYTKDHHVKTVWSCVIVDLDSKSPRIQKTTNECNTKKEVIDEALFQMRAQWSELPVPYRITVHRGVTRMDGRWDSIHSSYGNAVGPLPYRGRDLDNVFVVGPHNMGSFNLLNTAVHSAIRFANQEGIPIPKSFKPSFQLSSKSFSSRKISFFVCIICIIMTGRLLFYTI